MKVEVENYTYMYSSPIGNLILKSDGSFLTGIEIMKENRNENKELPIFKQTTKWLDDYFQGKEPEQLLPIKLKGTDFQKEVWNILLDIPYGQLITYGEIANKIAYKRNRKKMSSQAVGQAVGKNPIPILIPCHRVVGKNKNLVGFGPGIDLKIKLLKIEKVNLENFFFYDKNKKKKYVREKVI